MVALTGNQAANGENKPQPVALGETGLLDSLSVKVVVVFSTLGGRTALDELAGLLFLSHLHVGVDSAAPHIAAAVNTPTITIYSPSDWHD